MSKSLVIPLLRRIRTLVIETKYKLRQEFESFDPENSGKVSDDDFIKIVVELLGCPMDDDEVATLLSRYSSFRKRFLYRKLCGELQLEPSKDFQSDPALLFDRLPQPYRMLNKLLEECILGPVFEELEHRTASSGPERPGKSRRKEGFQVESLAKCEAAKLAADIPGLTIVASVSNFKNCEILFAGTDAGNIITMEQRRLYFHRSHQVDVQCTVSKLHSIRRPGDGAIILLAVFQTFKNCTDPGVLETGNDDNGDLADSSGLSDENYQNSFHLKLFRHDSVADSRLELLSETKQAMTGVVSAAQLSPDGSYIGISVVDHGELVVFPVPSSSNGPESSQTICRESTITEEVVETPALRAHTEEEEAEGDILHVAEIHHEPVLRISQKSFPAEFMCVTASNDEKGMFEFLFLSNRVHERFDSSWKISNSTVCMVRQTGSNCFHKFVMDGSNPLVTLPVETEPAVDSQDTPASETSNDLYASLSKKFPEIIGTAKPKATWYVHSEVTAWCYSDGSPMEQILAVGTRDGSMLLWDTNYGTIRDIPSRVPGAITTIAFQDKQTVVVGSALGHVASFKVIEQNDDKRKFEYSQHHSRFSCLGRRRDVKGRVLKISPVPDTPLCVVVVSPDIPSTVMNSRRFQRGKSGERQPPIRAGSAQQCVLIYDVQEPRPVAVLEPKQTSKGCERRFGNSNSNTNLESDMINFCFGVREAVIGTDSTNTCEDTSEERAVEEKLNNTEIICDGEEFEDHSERNSVDGSRTHCDDTGFHGTAQLLPTEVCQILNGDHILITCTSDVEAAYLETVAAQNGDGTFQRRSTKQNAAMLSNFDVDHTQINSTSGLLLFTLRDIVKSSFPSVARVCQLDGGESASSLNERGSVVGKGHNNKGWGNGKGLGGMASNTSLYSNSLALTTPIAQLYSQNEVNEVSVRRMLQITTAEQRADDHADLSYLVATGPLDIPGALATSPTKVTLRSVASMAKSTRSRQRSKRNLQSSSNSRSGLSRYAPSTTSQSIFSVGGRSHAGNMSEASGTQAPLLQSRQQLLIGPTAMEFVKCEGYDDPKLRVQEFLIRRGETRVYRESRLAHRQREWAAMALNQHGSAA